MHAKATTRTLTLIATLALGLAAASCNREAKPDHKGVFVVTGSTVTELQPIGLDTDFTTEGFAVRSFVGDPQTVFKSDKSYFIFYGDFRPFDLRPFRFDETRYTEDPSRGDFSGSLQTQGIAGERDMLKCRVTKHLPVGAYVFEVNQADNTSLHLAFRVE